MLDRWYVSLPVLILTVAFLIWILTPNGPNKKDEQLKANIAEQKGEANVIQTQRNTTLKEIEDAANNTNRALDNLNRSINRDSTTFDANLATNRFCKQFPEDSSCR